MEPSCSKLKEITFNFFSLWPTLLYCIVQRAITYIRHREVNGETMSQIQSKITQSDLVATRLSTSIAVPLFGEEFLAKHNLLARTINGKIIRGGNPENRPKWPIEKEKVLRSARVGRIALGGKQNLSPSELFGV